MAAYVFETMTADEARNISTEHTVRSETGTASATTVLFLPDGTYSVTIGARTLVFGPELPRLSGGIISYADKSILYVGSAEGDVKNQGVLPTAGAMYGGGGGDTLTGSPGAWLIQGNQGADRIVGHSGGSNTVYGGQDHDHISLYGLNAQFAQGNKGNDTIQGANGGDTLIGGQGADVLFGGGGQDLINGNLGDDRIQGAGMLIGEAGADHISGSGTLSGGDDNDTLVAGTTATPNVVHGGAGDDEIVSSSDLSDQLYGEAGADRISVVQNATFGAPIPSKMLDGGSGDDTLVARAGNDTLQGGADSDSLSGGAGADRMDGGQGADTLAGGEGVDVFVLTESSPSLDQAGSDLILDWSSEDRLAFRLAGPLSYAETTADDFAAALASAEARIADGSAEVVAVQVDGDVIVFADAGTANVVNTTVTLVGRTLADISSDSLS